MKMRFGMVALLGTAAAALVAVAPLGVQAQGAGAVVFTGATGSLNPAVQLVGGPGGTYTFSTAGTNALGVPGACAAVGADLDLGTDEIGLCTLSASGAYTNIVCGTGTAPGTATAAINGGDTITVAGYTLVFVAGIGVVVDGPPPVGGGVSDNEAGGGVAAGVVNIIPVVGNCVTPVSQFQASGAVVVAIP